ncbi:AAA family ATPase [Candidatus Micrarchaeota archaeon]|nr:AAA family ATPase [Candidatus Micrarchaeota archaeon]
MRTAFMIISVCGFRGSGKSLFGKVAKELGFPIFEMSEPVLEEMGKLSLERTNESVRKFATELREKKGKGIVAEMLAEKITEFLKKPEAVIVIGARSISEIEVFRKLDDVVCVAIVSDEEKRLERTAKRGKASDPTDLHGLRWADDVERKWGLQELIGKCDAQIENNGNEEEFMGKVKMFLERIE